MRLTNVYRVGDKQASHISICGSKIAADCGVVNDGEQLVFDKAIAFPGIINSHDHLEFNLFPQLGNGIYNNYTEWGNFIHSRYRQEIADIVNIPPTLRTQWGLYKNLLCGVTTVVNHGQKIAIANSPITVLGNEQSLHSVHFEKYWRRQLNHPFKSNIPVVIHTGEGTDRLASAEIDLLINWNLFRRKLIGIHGVAMNAKQASHFKALVWCPESNFYLLGKTAQITELKQHLPVLFGTDSTLTGNWNIWEHLRLARQTGMLTDQELISHFTETPAAVWQINSGKLAPGYDADIVVARLKDEQSALNGLFALNPADLLLVMHQGNIRLFDEALYSQLTHLPKSSYSKIAINGSYKYVYGNLPGLMKAIWQYNANVQFPVSFN